MLFGRQHSQLWLKKKIYELSHFSFHPINHPMLVCNKTANTSWKKKKSGNEGKYELLFHAQAFEHWNQFECPKSHFKWGRTFIKAVILNINLKMLQFCSSEVSLMPANIYHFILKCPRSSELFLLSSESRDLQTNIIGHFFFCWGYYSPSVFLLSLKNWPLFCIYLVILTRVVVNQSFVIHSFLSGLPAKIHSRVFLNILFSLLRES